VIFGGIQQLWPSSGQARLRFQQGAKVEAGGELSPSSPLTLTTAF